MLNDFTDHIKNVDKDNYFRADGHQGIFQVLGHHGDPRPSDRYILCVFEGIARINPSSSSFTPIR